MDFIIALHLSLTVIGAVCIWSFNIAFARRFGWRLLLAAARPDSAWEVVYRTLCIPLNYPFVGLLRLLEPEGYRQALREGATNAMEELAKKREVDVPMKDVVDWLEVELGNPGASPESDTTQ